MADGESRPVGRPSKYDPAYCDAVLADGRAGLSLTAFAGGIGVDRSTITEWVAVHPEFSAAVKQHQAARTRYLEETMLSAEQGPRVTARIFALKNAAPDEWKDKVALVGGGPDDAPIEVNATVSDRDRAKAVAALVAKAKG